VKEGEKDRVTRYKRESGKEAIKLEREMEALRERLQHEREKRLILTQEQQNNEVRLTS